MGHCKVCDREDRLISSFLGVCGDCIRNRFEQALPYIKSAHHRTRREFDLPVEPPQKEKGISCELCVNNCRMEEGEKGFCGLRKNAGNKLEGPNVKSGNLSYYYDPLPTNCVADWVCPGGTGSGFPEFSYSTRPEYGFKNLAVFYHGCSFNCLFCQNWHFRDGLKNPNWVSCEQLASCVDESTACICFFGGDPGCQINHAIEVAKIALGNKKNKILRICWETNGAINPVFVKTMVELSLHSGGCIKFDLKSFSQELNIALCGVSNNLTLENFKLVAGYVKKRKNPPLLIVSTLLIPGYVDEKEVENIARFIAELDPGIPYSLLAFYPCFYMNDLPTTSKQQAFKCLEVARQAGLKNVHLGNIHLLDSSY
jgi:pyruvate formate lyase activating enzyme